MSVDVKWLKKPAGHDYPAAETYLSLIYDTKKAKDYVKNLADAKMFSFAAKDIFRASGLPLLDADNKHVDVVRTQILMKEKLSPILLVRASALGSVIIADGYHRLCAVYTFDENAMIPCKIV